MGSRALVNSDDLLSDQAILYYLNGGNTDILQRYWQLGPLSYYHHLGWGEVLVGRLATGEGFPDDPYVVYYHPDVGLEHRRLKVMPELSMLEKIAYLEEQREAKKNPINRKAFNPSYKAETKQQYLAKVAACDALHGDVVAWRAAKCKRRPHKMIFGGRQALRYPTEPVAPVTPLTMQRLRLDNAPWNARTQSELSHARQNPRPKKAGKLEPLIAEGLARYMMACGTPDRLVVPEQPGILVHYGVPYKAAAVLVERAQGRAFFDSAPMPSMPHILMARILRVVGTGLQIRGTQLTRMPPKQAKGLIDPRDRQRRYVLDSIKVELGPKISTMLDKEIFETLYIKHREQIADYDPAEDDAAFLQELFDQRQAKLDQVLRERKLLKAIIHVRFVRENESIEGSFSYGEHSMSREAGGGTHKIDYRRLRGFTLSELPAVLATIAGRRSSSKRN